jgi:1-acyl-sn-glycerol-3-phosphate acyltransferase
MNQLKLLKSRRFLPLFVTQFLGAFNDNFFRNALVILVTYQATQIFGIPSAQIVAVAGGVFILPFFLFSAYAGLLADKYEKSRIVRWVKLAEIGIMLVASVGFLTERYEALLVVLFLMGLHSTVFGPIKYSILPQHLGEEELIAGNALVEAGTNLAILIGTIVGGLLILSKPHGAKLVSVGLVATAVIGWLSSHGIPVAEAADPGIKIGWNPVRPTWDILRFSRQTRSIFLSLLAISWFWFFGGFLLSLFPSYCKDSLHASSDVVTLFLTVFSIGTATGSLLCEKLSREHLELGLVPLGSIGMTVFTLDLWHVGIPAFAAAFAPQALGAWELLHHAEGIRIVTDLFLMSVFGGFFIVPLYAFIQIRSEKTHRSRIIASNNIHNALFMVGASVTLLALIRFRFTTAQMFLTLAVLNALVATYVYTVIPEFLFRFLVWCLTSFMYRLKVIGAENIPRHGAAVLVCNHVSFVDWMILSAGIKRPVRFVMDHHFARNWFMRRFAKRAKVILIAPARVDRALMERAFEQAAFELRDGELVGIFPEGKLTPDGELSPFKPGIERLVQETPVAVIPMALCNLWGSFFSRKDGPAFGKWPRRFWPRIELRIGAPIPPAQATAPLLQSRVAELLGPEASARPARRTRTG